jgi:hypothetical protein
MLMKKLNLILSGIDETAMMRYTTNCVSWTWRMNPEGAIQVQIVFAIVDGKISDMFSFVSIRPIRKSHRKRIAAQQISNVKLRNKYAARI